MSYHYSLHKKSFYILHQKVSHVSSNVIKEKKIGEAVPWFKATYRCVTACGRKT